MWKEIEPALFQNSPSPDEDGLSVCSTAESASAALSLSSHFSKIFLEESASFSGRNFRSRNSIIDWVSANLVASSNNLNQPLSSEINILASPDQLSELILHPLDIPAFEPPGSAPILEFPESEEIGSDPQALEHSDFPSAYESWKKKSGSNSLEHRFGLAKFMYSEEGDSEATEINYPLTCSVDSKYAKHQNVRGPDSGQAPWDEAHSYGYYDLQAELNEPAPLAVSDAKILALHEQRPSTQPKEILLNPLESDAYFMQIQHALRETQDLLNRAQRGPTRSRVGIPVRFSVACNEAGLQFPPETCNPACDSELDGHADTSGGRPCPDDYMEQLARVEEGIFAGRVASERFTWPSPNGCTRTCAALRAWTPASEFELRLLPGDEMDISFQCPEALRAEWWFGLRVPVGAAPGHLARAWRLPDELADLRRHAGYFPARCVRLAHTACTSDSNGGGGGGDGAFLRAASTSTCTSPTISSPEAESRSTLFLDDDDPEDAQTLGPLPVERVFGDAPAPKTAWDGGGRALRLSMGSGGGRRAANAVWAGAETMAEAAAEWPLTYQRTAGPLPVAVVFAEHSGFDSVPTDFVVNADPACSPCSSSCASFVLPARAAARSGGTPPALLPPAAGSAARGRHDPPSCLFFVNPMPEDSGAGCAAHRSDSPTTPSVVPPMSPPAPPPSPQQALLPLCSVPMWAAPPEGAGRGGGGFLLREWPTEVEGEDSGAPGCGKRGSFLLQYKAALLKDIDAAPHGATVARVDAEQLAGATAGKVAGLGAAVAVKGTGLLV